MDENGPQSSTSQTPTEPKSFCTNTRSGGSGSCSSICGDSTMSDLHQESCDNSNKVVTNSDTTNNTNSLEQELTHVINSSNEQIPDVSDTNEWWPNPTNLRQNRWIRTNDS